MEDGKQAQKLYFSACKSQVPRLLSQLNREPFTKNYGSFDRPFWLHRTADFSSNIKQIGFHSLALLWNYDDDENSYYKNEKILQWAFAGIRYCLELQKKDGSFDEWYPNERGWAGPTAYILHALCDSYKILSHKMSNSLKDECIGSIKKSAQLLANGWEPDVLSNHIAIALLALYETYEILEDVNILSDYNKLFKVFEDHNSPEGWGLEYDGADIGYQTATLSFLSRIHKINSCEKIKLFAGKSFQFLSYFYYPDGSFSNRFGSRQTSVSFVLAAEYWAQKIEIAGRIALAQRRSLATNNMILPEQHEDHYLFYRMPEFLEASAQAQTINKNSTNKLLPWEKDSFSHYFSEAKIYIKNTSQYYFCANLGRGGTFQLYNKDTEKNVYDSGWTILLESSEVYTSSIINESRQITVEESHITVSGSAQQVRDPSFTPYTMLLFRCFMMLFGRNEILSRKIKSFIRKVLMFGKSKKPLSFERSFSLNNTITVHDKIFVKAASVKTLRIGGNFENRMVPQSRYFQKFDLEKHDNYFSAKQFKEKSQNHCFEFRREL